MDVYTVRDLSNLIQHEDGFFNPGGKVVGLKEFSAKEFAERDIDAIKNLPMEVTYAGEGGGLMADALQAIAEEYAAFGVTYDARIDQWYFHNEPVRDFANLDVSGNGTLTGIEKFSQAEFDERTRSSQAVQIREVQTSSGECTVIQQ